jgi:hypothetical protein
MVLPVVMTRGRLPPGRDHQYGSGRNQMFPKARTASILHRQSISKRKTNSFKMPQFTGSFSTKKREISRAFALKKPELSSS